MDVGQQQQQHQLTNHENVNSIKFTEKEIAIFIALPNCLLMLLAQRKKPFSFNHPRSVFVLMLYNLFTATFNRNWVSCFACHDRQHQSQSPRSSLNYSFLNNTNRVINRQKATILMK